MISFSSEKYTSPVWEGNVAFAEMFWPVRAKGEEEVRVRLLYPADEVLSLCDSRLEREFVSGRDFCLQDGELIIPPSSNIITTRWEEFNLSREQEQSPFKVGCTLGGWLFFGEASWITDKQYTVSYRHSAKWNGYIPSKTPGSLPRLTQTLAQGKPFTFAFFGDSITTGANSSGADFVNVPPYAPIWSRLVCSALTEKYGCPITHINRAVGGMNTRWGKENIYPLFRDDAPDVFLIAFGMNDADVTSFGEDTVAIIEDALRINPQAEIILVSTMLPHELAAGFYREQYKQEEILQSILPMYGDRITLARMTSVHKELLLRKRYYDMTGNNVNHPNDYLASVYAQTVLAVIG